MDKVNIKIGQIVYSDVSIINVDKADGGTANFVYDGVNNPIQLSSSIYQNTHKTTVNITPTFTTHIELR